MIDNEKRIEAAARALRRERNFDETTSFPCPFCRWPRDETGQLVSAPSNPAGHETGCIHLAEATLAAADAITTENRRRIEHENRR